MVTLVSSDILLNNIKSEEVYIVNIHVKMMTLNLHINLTYNALFSEVD